MKKIIFGLIACGLFSNFASYSINSELSSISEKASDLKQLKEELETYKLSLKLSINNFKQIQKTLDSMELSEKIQKMEESLHKIENISFNINHQKQMLFKTKENKTSKDIKQQKKSYNENLKSIEAFGKNLKGFHQALQNSETRFNTILNKGSKLFDNKQNKLLFNSENIPSDLQDSYLKAFNAWSEIKYMTNTDKEFDKKMNSFRTKIQALYENLAKIKIQTQKN